MSDQLLRTVLGGVLLLHGLGHGGAIGALAWIGHFGPDNTGDWHAARSWLLPDLAPSTATAIACGIWALALIGFVAAALAFWGVGIPIGLPVGAWHALALGSAIVSAVGITLFIGNWPAFNTLAALAVNVAVIVALWMRWPPETLFGA